MNCCLPDTIEFVASNTSLWKGLVSLTAQVSIGLFYRFLLGASLRHCITIMPARRRV